MSGVRQSMAGWFAAIEAEPHRGSVSEFDATVIEQLAARKLVDASVIDGVRGVSAGSHGAAASSSSSRSEGSGSGQGWGDRPPSSGATTFFIPETLLLRSPRPEVQQPVGHAADPTGPAARDSPSPLAARPPTSLGRKTWVPVDDDAEQTSQDEGGPSGLADGGAEPSSQGEGSDDPDAAASAPEQDGNSAHVELQPEELVEVDEASARDGIEIDAGDVEEVAEGELDPKPPAVEGSVPPPAPSKRAEKRRNWFADAFGEDFSSLVDGDIQETARLDARFLDARLGLSRGDRVLDVGCGAGRHCMAFAERGYNVTGIDLSVDLLELGRAQNRTRQEPVEFIERDMRTMTVDQRFNAVVCLGSTFGYFDDETNRVCVERMRDALEPGGRLALQVFNRDFIISRLPCRSWWRGDGCLVLDEVDMDGNAERLTNHRTIVFEDGRQTEHNISIRAYSAHELSRLVHAAGLRVSEISGDRATGEIFFPSSATDIWLVATR